MAAREPVRSTSVPYLVFGLLACAAVFSAAVVNGVIHDQERRLLDQRAQAAGALVSTSFSGFTSTMPLLGALAQPGLGGPDLFEGGRDAVRRERRQLGTAQAHRRRVRRPGLGRRRPAADARPDRDRTALW